MGGDDPRRQQQDPNVIIPDIGAGRYWYVDPKAGVAQQPAAQLGQQSAAQVYDPMANERSNQAQLKAWGEQVSDLVNRFGGDEEARKRAALEEALQRMFGRGREELRNPESRYEF